jgi:hypothetical protein
VCVIAPTDGRAPVTLQFDPHSRGKFNMTMYRRLALPIVLAGCAALGTALMVFRRNTRRGVATQQHKENLQSWEGEGGSHLVPAAAQSLPPISAEQRTDIGSNA